MINTLVDTYNINNHIDIDAVLKMFNDASQSIGIKLLLIWKFSALNLINFGQLASSLLVHPSVLLSHECAFLLGQRKEEKFLNELINVASNIKYDPILRHEAIEAISHIGTTNLKSILVPLLNDDSKLVRETVLLALEYMNEKCESSNTQSFVSKSMITTNQEISSNLKSQEKHELVSNDDTYGVHDPIQSDASMLNLTENGLCEIMMNPHCRLSQRYQALYCLRHKPNKDLAISCISKGLLDTSSELLRHEVAYVLGQMAVESSIDSLLNCINNEKEDDVVRHEAIISIGSIYSHLISMDLSQYQKCIIALNQLKNSPIDIVKESCITSLIMMEKASN